MLSEPRLIAVIESPPKASPFVGDVPPQPWPSFVRLFGQSSDGDVALVVAQLAQYGQRGGGRQSIEALVRKFPTIVAGGLAAEDGRTTVHPSCCCGLESWRDWHGLLSDGHQPWLGHDPSPWVEKRGEEFLVWPDGGLGAAKSVDLQPVRFSSRELAASLGDVERDLNEFVGRLREWTAARGPDYAEALAKRFRALARLS
jgi:hypothetical protein